MKKGKGIGIGVAVIALAIVFGIASLPDEVLLESPQLDTSENLPSEMIPMDIASIILEEPVLVEEPIEEVVEEAPVLEVAKEPIEVAEESETPGESENNIITVKINDGVGAKMR